MTNDRASAERRYWNLAPRRHVGQRPENRRCGVRLYPVLAMSDAEAAALFDFGGLV